MNLKEIYEMFAAFCVGYTVVGLAGQIVELFIK